MVVVKVVKLVRLDILSESCRQSSQIQTVKTVTVSDQSSIYAIPAGIIALATKQVQALFL